MKATNDGELRNLFRTDAEKIMESLRLLFGSFDKKQYDAELVNRCFRHVHSLKSEASFLGYAGLVRQSEAMESILASVRSRQLPLADSELEGLKDVFVALDRDLKPILGSLGIEASRRNVPRTDEEGVFVPDGFERVMLKEARERGERLFRLDATVGAAEPMPFPRLYLVVNNLELHTNVVRVFPPLERLKKGDVRSVSIFLTSRRDADAVKGLLDVDQIEGLDLRELTFDDYVGAETAVSKDREARRKDLKFPRYRRSERKSVSMDFSVLDASAFLVSCLSSKAAGKGRERGPAEIVLGSIRERLLGYIGLPCSLSFEKAKRVAEDLAAKLGKRIRVETRGDLGALLSPRVFDALNEILLHLIRNGMDHGIESPAERADGGKPIEGRIVLEARIKDGVFVIRVADDGRGIKIEEVRGAAKTLGLELPEGADLITCLTFAGFSTKENSSAVSGRGVGLDIVKGIVESSLGGRLELVSESAKGTIFTVSFREEDVRFSVFAAKTAEGKPLLFPKELVEEIFPFYREAAVRTEKGFSYRVGGTAYPVLVPGDGAEDGVGILYRDRSGKPRIFFAKEVAEESRAAARDVLPSVVALFSV